jgi:CheY-like chemotaxis protein
MPGGQRILVAAALGRIIEPALRQEFSDATIRMAGGRAEVEQAVRAGLRFDAVITDLTWSDYTVEFSFDGLDVLDILRQTGRPAPVVFALQGHGIERDYLDEVLEQPEVAGIYWKATGLAPLVEAVEIATRGGRLPVPACALAGSPPGMPRIHGYFSKGRGVTAARLAGAIASGRAVNHETLAKTALVGYDTATKLVDYLGPLIRARGEHPSELKMTPEAVYRWCGEHARYILSWCRRNGQLDLATRVIVTLVA